MGPGTGPIEQLDLTVKDRYIFIVSYSILKKKPTAG